MPSLNYQPRFAADVAAGRKRRTIRAKRKHPIKAGDTLYHYTGMRRPGCRRLLVIPCSRERTLRILRTRVKILYRNYTVTLKLAHQLNAFARADGFASWTDMREWFRTTHGFPFLGQLIMW